MKIRSGFVSNSSSSSFVLGKNFITEKQIVLFDKWLKYQKDLANDKNVDWTKRLSTETFIVNGKYYFHGVMEQHDINKVNEYLQSIGVNLEHVEGESM